MILYHFTSPTHLPFILHAGYLAVTESNVSMSRPHAAADVVWLTNDPTPLPERFAWARGTINDKTAVRFKVDVSRRAAQPWLSWSVRQGMRDDWRKALIRSGGGMGAARTWYVVARPVLASEWVEIRDVRTDTTVPMCTGNTPPPTTIVTTFHGKITSVRDAS
jgi:hypothetical protein